MTDPPPLWAISVQVALVMDVGSEAEGAIWLPVFIKLRPIPELTSSTAFLPIVEEAAFGTDENADFATDSTTL
jgi:hypothetical protein